MSENFSSTKAVTAILEPETAILEPEEEIIEFSEEGTGELEEELELELSDQSRWGINIGVIPLLSREEERELFQRFKETQDPSKKDRIKNKIVESNLRLVAFWVIKNSHPLGCLKEKDLFQEGSFGLMRAVDGFNLTKGYKFSTYASWWIQQAIRRALDDQNSSIRIPIHRQEEIRKFLKAKGKFTQKLGQEPSDEEIAEEMKVPLATIHWTERNIGLQRITSLNKQFGSDGDLSLLDLVEDKSESVENIIEEMERNNFNKNIVSQLLDLLGDTEGAERRKEVLRLWFGLKDGRHQTLADISREFKVTRERIRQLRDDGLNKLRKIAKTRKAQKLLEELAR